MRPLDITWLQDQICELPRFGRISYTASIGSTNAAALERLYHNDWRGISFVTESQSEGRGRAGRTWLSAPGSGLLLSTILPSELVGTALSAVGFWAALAVRETCLQTHNIALDLKWPNDLLLAGRKCAGILAQGRSVTQGARVVVGVGLNVNRPDELPDEILSSVAWLSDSTGHELDRTALLAALLSAYERNFDQLLKKPSAVISDWQRVARLDGKRVAVKALDGSTMHEGVVEGITGDGGLVLQTQTGTVKVTLGDVDVLA